MLKDPFGTGALALHSAKNVTLQLETEGTSALCDIGHKSLSNRVEVCETVLLKLSISRHGFGTAAS